MKRKKNKYPERTRSETQSCWASGSRHWTAATWKLWQRGGLHLLSDSSDTVETMQVKKKTVSGINRPLVGRGQVKTLAGLSRFKAKSRVSVVEQLLFICSSLALRDIQEHWWAVCRRRSRGFIFYSPRPVITPANLLRAPRLEFSFSLAYFGTETFTYQPLLEDSHIWSSINLCCSCQSGSVLCF